MARRREHNYQQWTKKYEAMNASDMADWLFARGRYAPVLKNVSTGEYYRKNGKVKEGHDVQLATHPACVGIFASPNHGKKLAEFKKRLSERGELSSFHTKELHSLYSSRIQKVKAKYPHLF